VTKSVIWIEIVLCLGGKSDYACVLQSPQEHEKRGSGRTLCPYFLVSPEEVRDLMEYMALIDTIFPFGLS